MNLKNGLVNFGPGEYEQVSGKDRPSISDMRTEFLRLANEVKPDILGSLQADLLPLYKQIPLICFEARAPQSATHPGVGKFEKRSKFTLLIRPSWEILADAFHNREPELPFAQHFPELSDTAKTFFEESPSYAEYVSDGKNIVEFIVKMEAWSKQHDLDAAWCRRHAYETLDLWAGDDKYRESRTWQHLPWNLLTLKIETEPLGSDVPDLDLAIILNLKPFDLKANLGGVLAHYPTHIRRSLVEKVFREWRAHVELCEKRVTELLDKKDAEAARLGFVKSISKRSREHLNWFVQAHILHKSYKEISETYNSKAGDKNGRAVSLEEPTKTVRRGVNEVSKILDLPLRSNLTSPGQRPA